MALEREEPASLGLRIAGAIIWFLPTFGLPLFCVLAFKLTQTSPWITYGLPFLLLCITFAANFKWIKSCVAPEPIDLTKPAPYSRLYGIWDKKRCNWFGLGSLELEETSVPSVYTDQETAEKNARYHNEQSGTVDRFIVADIAKGHRPV